MRQVRRTWVLPLAVAAVVPVALAIDRWPSSATASSQPHQAAPRCTAISAEHVRALPLRGTLRGDLDGDGRADLAGMGVRRGAPLACRYVLWVRIRSQTITAVVRQQLYESPGSPVPYLVELARVNRGPGVQLVVDFGVGAYVRAYGLYRVGNRRIMRMRVAGTHDYPYNADTFPSGAGGAGGVYSICAEGPGSGRVLVASYSTKGVGPPPIPKRGAVYVQRGNLYALRDANGPLTAVQRANWRKTTHRMARIFANCAIAAVG